MKFLKYKKINNFAVISFSKIYEFAKVLFIKGFFSLKFSLIFSYAIREESLGMMRYSKYMEIAATKDEIKIASRPPSENAA